MSKQSLGWGTLLWLVLTVMISSCSRSENAREQEPGQTFDYFKAQCNASPSSIISTIVGGQKLKKSDPDSHNSVLLIIQNKSGKQTLCSSTVINQKVLITAGHCLTDATKVQAVFSTSVNCDSGYSRSQNSIETTDFVIHDQFSLHNIYINSEDSSLENPDLALIHLPRPVPRNYPVFKIARSIEDSDLFIFGYGVTNLDSTDGMVLRKTRVASENYKVAGNNLIVDQHDKPGICQGDSGGGGLVLDKNDNLELLSVNSVISFANGTAESEQCNQNASLVVVAQYRDWIRSNLKNWKVSLDNSNDDESGSVNSPNNPSDEPEDGGVTDIENEN